MATQLARSLSLDLRITFLVLKSHEIPFLVSDQPAFNLRADELDANGKVKNFELYYPLSFDTAIVVQVADKPGERFQEIQLNSTTSNYFNKKVVEIADSFVFK